MKTRPLQPGTRLGEELLMAEEDLTAEIERLKAENERLRKRQSRALSIKVSQKGALSVYGLGRFPVTLYKGQWTKTARGCRRHSRFPEGQRRASQLEGHGGRQRLTHRG